MKRISLLLTLIALTISTIWANPIDPSTAKSLAQTFWAQKFAHRGSADFRDVTSETGVRNFYIFNNEAGAGFVIIAGDDCAVPVLAYSESNNFKTENMPANLHAWLQRYDNIIRTAVERHVQATAEIAQQWTNLRAGNLPMEGSRESVSPWYAMGPGCTVQQSLSGQWQFQVVHGLCGDGDGAGDEIPQLADHGYGFPFLLL